jgi:hypothetical protein
MVGRMLSSHASPYDFAEQKCQLISRIVPWNGDLGPSGQVYELGVLYLVAAGMYKTIHARHRYANLGCHRNISVRKLRLWIMKTVAISIYL